MKRRKITAWGLPHEKYGVWNEMFDMKRYLHNLNLGFIQLKRNVHFDSTDHDCPKEPPRSEWAANHTRSPIAQDSSKGNQCTRRSKHSMNRIWRTRLSAHHKEIVAQHCICNRYNARHLQMCPQQLLPVVPPDIAKVVVSMASVQRDHVSDRDQAPAVDWSPLTCRSP